MRKLLLLMFLSLTFLLCCSYSNAEEEKESCFSGIEILTGFAWSDIHNQDDYNLIPLNLAFNFNLKKLTEKINFNPRQLLQFQIEPFLGFISSPDANFEMGNNFWLKIGLFPDTWKFQPYGKLGVGIDYMTLHTKEQSTQFNFTEAGAIGIHYFFNPNTALTVEGRFRHLSNSGIKHPNHGINTYFVLTGITYNF